MRALSILRLCIAGAVGALAAGPAVADSYPSRPIEFVVPYAPGGASDIVVRALAPQLQKQLGASIVVINRAGANTAIAATQLARSAPDGYTIMLADVALVLNAAVRRTSPGYDVAKDFSTIAQVGSAPLVLFVPASGAADLPSFLKQAHDRPVNIANAGPGSLGHLAAELLQLRTKTTLASVPYRGSGPAMNETIAGQVDAIFTSTASGMPLVKSGRLRPLAVASPEPLKDFPEIPTFDRLGVQGVHVLNWWGVIAPAGLPADISARIAKAVAAAMRDPAIVERFAALGISPSTRDAAAFAGLMSKEFAAWRDVATQAGIKVD